MSAERSPKNVPASVRARLSDLARRQGIEFQLVLAEFAIERLLYRLGVSDHAERFVLTIQSECLDQLIFFGKASLVHAIQQFLIHYNAERNHQGLQNRLLAPAPSASRGRVFTRARLGGLLNYYYRKAA